MDRLLKNYTTLKIGGPATKVTTVKSGAGLLSSVKKSITAVEKYIIIGHGSNLLVSDEGFEGRIIKNDVRGIKRSDTLLTVQSGTPLQQLIDSANQQGLEGLQQLAGIPGTVGGAIYGNAGAYGQTISDCLHSVTYFDTDEDRINIRFKDKCGFEYRNSLFKQHKNMIILEAEFKLKNGDPDNLKKLSSETVRKREVKYPPGIKCPGSFFKNIIAESLPDQVLSRIPPDKIMYGKIPAGSLLELVGAKGARQGEIEIATYHANLFINTGNGTASDFYQLAQKFAQKVYREFGIKLEPEVQFINLPAFRY